MHGQQSPLTELRYGQSGTELFLRFDLNEPSADLRIHLRFESGSEWNAGLKPASAPLRTEFDRILEVAVPLDRALHNGALRLQLSIWNGPLPIDALPAEGWLELG